MWKARNQGTRKCGGLKIRAHKWGPTFKLTKIKIEIWELEKQIIVFYKSHKQNLWLTRFD